MKKWGWLAALSGLCIGGLALLGQFSEGNRQTFIIDNVSAAPELGSGKLLAGVAEVDITPAPGYLPRAGYATWSTIGEGFRTRLYARVYYLQDADGDSHAIVQTDLTSGSRILHARLGAYVAEKTDIDASKITLTATHSHSAPGQIVGSRFYNKHISNQPGFAQDYFEFLVKRIGDAIIRSYQTRRPAVLAAGKIPVWGITRNRSLPAYVENHTVGDKQLTASQTFHAVNPMMYMVRIDALTDSGEREPMGAFASFSIHGTAVPQSETLFNGDVWAYIHGDWLYQVKQQDGATFKTTPVLSAFEGVHGDVAPAARFGLLGYIEARRIGSSIADYANRLYQELTLQLQADVDITSSIRYINIRQQPGIDQVEICRDAAAGMTLAAAPDEHTSPVIGYLPFFKQGSRRWGDEADNCQGRKRILGFDALQSLLEPKDSFPDYVNFQLVKIGHLLMVPLPFELTTESGRRIEARLKQVYQHYEQEVPDVMVTSLAGGYTGYITTPEEYERQYYEGGHTLYGKDSQPYLEAHLSVLANDMLMHKKRRVDLPDQWVFDLAVKDFFPPARAALGQRFEQQAPVYEHASVNQEGFWSFRWVDVHSGLINLHEPLLSIEVENEQGQWLPLESAGRVVNDLGFDMGVRLRDDYLEKGMAEYEAYWFNPVFEGQQRRFRFAVEARDKQSRFYSSPFN